MNLGIGLTCAKDEKRFARLEDTFIVICKDQGKYVLATRQVFGLVEVAEEYARSCCPSRQAIVVPGDFRSLRWMGKP